MSSSKPDHTAKPGVVYTMAGEKWLFNRESEWVLIAPGDTWQGKVLVPVPAPPLPVWQQYVGGLRLVRGWNLANGDRLKAFQADHIWTAEAQLSHTTPSLRPSGVSSTCGFYGFFDWDQAASELRQHGTIILGSYIGWGRCVRGTKGFRCQYAKVEHVFYGSVHSSVTAPDRKIIDGIAKKYGVQALELDAAKRLRLGRINFREDQK